VSCALASLVPNATNIIEKIRAIDRGRRVMTFDAILWI
jgi:hypothetical protein